MGSAEIEELIEHLALENACRFGGKTSPGVVAGHLIARRPDVASTIKELMPMISSVCDRVNSMKLEDIQREVQRLGAAPPVMTRRGPPPELELPLNPQIPGHVLRFAPNPDGPLTLGNARPALLCDYFAKRYGGKFILRFEDTSPSVKPPLLEAYGWVIEDLSWLDISVNEVYYQSDRLELYYSRASQLFEVEGAYVCLCSPEKFRTYVKEQRPCAHRGQSPERNLELWRGMLSGKFKAGEAVVRVKTDLSHPNPAVRDWPALRVDEAPHPRVGSGYRVWPLYNWSAAVDDHEMGVTHIIRAKEHLTNEIRQSYAFNHFGWKIPTAVTIGRVKLEGSVLSKSKIMAGLREGTYSGMADPRVGTLKSLRRRGILPEVIREAILDMGIKPIEATIKWDNLCASNRAKVDRTTKRFFFVPSPSLLIVKGTLHAESVTLPNHPDNKELGERKLALHPTQNELRLLIPSADLSSASEDQVIRLMGLSNVRLTHVDRSKAVAEFLISDVTEARANVIQWVPEGSAVPTSVLMPDAIEVDGLSEINLASEKVGAFVQLIRFGFVKLEEVQQDTISAVFAHR